MYQNYHFIFNICVLINMSMTSMLSQSLNIYTFCIVIRWRRIRKFHPVRVNICKEINILYIIMPLQTCMCLCSHSVFTQSLVFCIDFSIECFVFFVILAIVLYVRWFTASDYPFSIFKLFFFFLNVHVFVI